MWRGRKKEEIWACFMLQSRPRPLHAPSIHPFKKMLPSLPRSSSADLDKRRRGTMYEQEERGCLAGSGSGEEDFKAFAPLPFPFMPHNDSSRRCRPSPGITRISAISPSQSECSAQKRQTRKDRNILWWHKAKRRKEGRQEGVPSDRSRPRPES